MKNDIQLGDTNLWTDGMTSKHSDVDNTKIMSLRNYISNMETLLDALDKVKTWGTDNSTDESINLSIANLTQQRFFIDVICSIIVQHVKETVDYWEKEVIETPSGTGLNPNPPTVF
jgi:hypothetical protein